MEFIGKNEIKELKKINLFLTVIKRITKKDRNLL